MLNICTISGKVENKKNTNLFHVICSRNSNKSNLSIYLFSNLSFQKLLGTKKSFNKI